jgi:hypothetical protein
MKRQAATVCRGRGRKAGAVVPGQESFGELLYVKQGNGKKVKTGGGEVCARLG